MNIINNPVLNGAIVTLLFGISFYLGLLIFTRNRKSKINRVFTIFAIAMAFWLVLAYIPDLPFLRSYALISAKLNYIALLIVCYTLFLFPFIFPRERHLNIFVKFAILGIGIFIGGLTLFTDQIIKGLNYFDWGASYIDGDTAGLFYLYMMFGALSAMVQYIYLMRRLKARERIQIRLFVAGLSIFLLTNIIVQSIIKPLITHTDEFYKVGNYSAIFMLTFTGYAIIKHRFMDIKLIVARAVSFTILIMYVTFVYSFLLALLVQFFSQETLSIQTIFITAVLFLIMATTLQPIRRFIEKITDSLFYKDRYNSGKLLYNLALSMASILRLEKLTHELLDTLLATMRISRSAFILVENEKIYEVAHKGYTKNPEFDEQKVLTLLSENKVLIFEELQDGTIKDLMRDADLTIAIPLRASDKTSGLLVLGEKLSGEVYNATDIEVLETFAPEAAVAIENAKAYEEISRFNITLREEVESATKDLQVVNEKLKALDQLKDEFVSLASHELRTPMTAIKSYLWLFLQTNYESLDEKQKMYIQRAFESTDRLINLVNDMLNVSRIESGRITLLRKSIDLVQVAKDVMYELTPSAQKQQVELKLHTESETFPHVVADANKLKEVFVNLVGNALKFTDPKGSITIKIEQDNKKLVTHIIDSGKGIEKEDLPKLFQKFGIVGNEYLRKRNSQGTGLGLYISKSIINLHGGEIWVDSEGKDKGTTFSFSLPIEGSEPAETQDKTEEKELKVEEPSNENDEKASNENNKN